MGNKNEITRVNPLSQTACLVNLKAIRPKRFGLSFASFETTPKRFFSICNSIGKSIPIYVNNFTNSLPYRGLMVIIKSDIWLPESAFYRGCKWQFQTQRKISMLSLPGLFSSLMIPVQPAPIYINKHDNDIWNKNTLF
jgi:hypothetical protein